MKCPQCGSLNADEINVSINWSKCVPGEEVEYEGWTEYGDTSSIVGIGCNDCCASTWLPNALETATEFFRSEMKEPNDDRAESD